jgi:hypothetical protein
LHDDSNLSREYSLLGNAEIWTVLLVVLREKSPPFAASGECADVMADNSPTVGAVIIPR